MPLRITTNGPIDEQINEEVTTEMGGRLIGHFLDGRTQTLLALLRPDDAESRIALIDTNPEEAARIMAEQKRSNHSILAVLTHSMNYTHQLQSGPGQPFTTFKFAHSEALISNLERARPNVQEDIRTNPLASWMNLIGVMRKIGMPPQYHAAFVEVILARGTIPAQASKTALESLNRNIRKIFLKHGIPPQDQHPMILLYQLHVRNWEQFMAQTNGPIH